MEVAMANPGGTLSPPDQRRMIDKRVVMVTGSHHLQVYWVESEVTNGLWQVPWSWSIEDRKWIPTSYTALFPPLPNQSLHRPAPWNGVCIRCHSVAGKPGFDRDSRKFATRVAELGIACEACHGPGEKHVNFHRLGGLAKTKANANTGSAAQRDPTIVHPAKCSKKVKSEICAQCHSAFKRVKSRTIDSLGMGYQAGDDLKRTHLLLRFDQAD